MQASAFAAMLDAAREEHELCSTENVKLPVLPRLPEVFKQQLVTIFP